MHLVEIHTRKNSRLNLFYYVFGILILALILGLASRQLIQQNEFRSKARKQSMRRILQPGTRGDIFDRNGKLLVGNRPLFSAVIDLGELRGEFRKEYIRMVRKIREQENPPKVNRHQLSKQARFNILQSHLNTINQILGREIKINQKKFEQHFHQKLLLPFPIIKDLTLEEYARLTEYILIDSPIQIFADSARYYPYGSSSSHILGYVASTLDVSKEGVPGNSLRTFSILGKIGKTGLEKQFDKSLQGASGGEVWRVDPAGFQYERIKSKLPSQGEKIITSLDIDIQQLAESALDGHPGSAILMDIKTGELLAAASTPTYDLNELTPYISNPVYEKITHNGAWLNRTTQGLYPPGSPFKLITFIAAMRAGVIDAHKHIVSNCTGGYMVGNRRYPCHHLAGHGDVDLERAIASSCNVFIYEHILATGVSKISEEARRFGFDVPTGIELPFETTRVLVPTKEWKKSRGLGNWYLGDTANMSLGQGYLLSTPLQVACFTSSLARNETRTKPTLLKVDKDKQDSINHAGEPIGLSPENYQALINGMKRATDAGTARFAQVNGLSIASKTGTAQVPYKGQYINLAWYAGFAPIEDPQVSVTVLVDIGKNFDHLMHGGAEAAPIAQLLYQAWADKYGDKYIKKEALPETETAS